MKVKNDKVSEPSTIKGVVSDWTDFPRHQGWGVILPQPPCRTVFSYLNTSIQASEEKHRGGGAGDGAFFRIKKKQRNPESTFRNPLLKKQHKNYGVWFSRLENAQIIGFKQDIHCSKQPYGLFEPETPNNEKTKEENTPHSQQVFLMETQFWQLYHLLYIIKLKETMNRKGVEDRHC